LLDNAIKFTQEGTVDFSVSLNQVRAQKASIHFKVEKGSTFSTNINFKLDFNIEPATKEVKKERKKRHRKYNVLLVEDSEISQLSVLKILASQGHFFLDIMSNVDNVIEKIENSDFDLLLLDIKIHDQYGDDLAKLIRKLPEREHKRIPIIALTAKVFKEDLRRYKKAGINHVVKKPFDEETLLDAIDEYLK